MMSCVIKRHFRIFVLCVIGISLVSCNASDSTNSSGGEGATADIPHSYAGETVTVVIGLDASAGGTTVGRLLAKHLEANLDGNPTVIVNNMPGASSLNAHLHVLLRAPKDGTTVYYGPRSSLGELLEFPGFTFKYSEFTPLGGIQIAALVVYARTDSLTAGYTQPSELVGSEALLFGGMPPEHGRMIISTMGLDLMNMNYKYIGGYPGSGNIRASIISGEVNAATDAAHAYINQVVPVLVEQGDALPVFSLPVMNAQGELVQNALVPDIPSLPDLYQTLNGEAPAGVLWDAITTMVELDQTMQHVFLGPPGMDAAAAETFRVGLEKAMATASFAEEAQQILSYVPEHVGYQRQAEILGATEKVTPEVLDYIKGHIEKNSGY